MTLSIYQFQFTPNGSSTPFVWGNGTPYLVEEIDGLGGSSPIRNQDLDRGYIDGAYSGRDFYADRTVTFDMKIIGDSSHSAQYYYRQFQLNLYPQPLGYYPDPYASTQATGVLGLFQFQLSAITGIQRMWGRVRLIETNIDPEFSFGYITCTLEMYFPDPRYYDDTAIVSSSGTTVSLSNAGWATTCPAITISSPSASGSITDNTNGNTMGFANVNTSYPLIIDLLRRTITQNGVSARNTLTTFNNWLCLPPVYSTTWTSTLGSMQMTYRNAYN